MLKYNLRFINPSALYDVTVTTEKAEATHLSGAKPDFTVVALRDREGVRVAVEANGMARIASRDTLQKCLESGSPGYALFARASVDDRSAQ